MRMIQKLKKVPLLDDRYITIWGWCIIFILRPRGYNAPRPVLLLLLFQVRTIMVAYPGKANAFPSPGQKVVAFKVTKEWRPFQAIRLTASFPGTWAYSWWSETVGLQAADRINVLARCTLLSRPTCSPLVVWTSGLTDTSSCHSRFTKQLLIQANVMVF